MAGIYGTDGADTKSGTPGDDIIMGYPHRGDPNADTGGDTLNGLGTASCGGCAGKLQTRTA